MPDTKIKPHICVVKIDETEFWQDDHLVQTAKKIFGVYVYDANRHVHCCEVTPSYELHPVGSQPLDMPEGEMEQEKFLDEIDSGDADSGQDVRYMHVASIDKMPEISQYGALQEGRFTLSHLKGEEWGETSDEAIEEALEYVRANSV